VLSNCEYCGKQFESRPAGHRLKTGGWAKTRYCSRKCHYNARKKIRPVVICEYCGKEFAPTWANARYCSRECLFDSMKRGKLVRCRICSKEFYAPMTVLKNNRAKVCSLECKKKLISFYMRGEKHPHWTGGRKDGYPQSEWTKQLREEIKKRDNMTCQKCGESNAMLIVHHLDGNKNNCAPINLTTLCRKCHSHIHYSHRYYRYSTNYEGGYLSL